MSGGGGSSSDSGGGNDMQVSGMEAAYSNEPGISTHAESYTGSTQGYEGSDAGWAASQSGKADTSTVGIAGGNVDSDDEYDTPDKDHYNQTQKEIKQRNKELAKSGQLDTSMTKEEYDQFNKDLNKYYGTENVKYEPHGRAGKGTVNLTFKEHWDNLGHQSTMAKYSPVARFLMAAGRNIKEGLTSDYGTHRYGGPGTDQGGLLGRLGGGGSGGPYQTTARDRDVMNQLAPDAPYIVSGTQRPPSSVAQNWFNNLGSGSGSLSFQAQYSAAKSKQQSILGKPSSYGWLAVNQSPFYNWLKENSLDKGIL